METEHIQQSQKQQQNTHGNTIHITDVKMKERKLPKNERVRKKSTKKRIETNFFQ